MTDEPIGEESTGEEDVGFVEVAYSPGLDPKSRPSTMGISFTCTTEAELPEFEVALSWARYVQVEHAFQRRPRAVHLGWDDIQPHLTHAGPTYRATMKMEPDDPEASTPKLRLCLAGNEPEATLSIVLRLSDEDSGVWTVTLMVTSRLKPRENGYDPDVDAELNIHQPEIRVHLKPGTATSEAKWADVGHGDTDDDSEAAVDAALYSGRGQVARGHLCSAVWRSFDPQAIDSVERTELTASLDDDGETRHLGDMPPFAWVDRNHPALAVNHQRFLPSGCSK